MEAFDGEAICELLLQLDTMRTQLPVACKLMCCSKALGAAVARHCTGRLSIDTADDRWRSTPGIDSNLAAWLRKHAALLGSLKLAEALLPMPATTQALEAAAAAGALQLQSLASTSDGLEDHLALLERLPPQRLTELVLPTAPRCRSWHSLSNNAAVLSFALSRLTALRRLDLSTLGRLQLHHLSTLTNLTALRQGAFENLAHLPTQLLELHVVHHFIDRSDFAENGGRLSQLTRLTKLQQLHLHASGMDAWPGKELRQLSGLTALSLGSPIEGLIRDLPSAAAWSSLPLRRLELDNIWLSESACQHLAQLQGLTSLVVRQCGFPTATAQQLAAALGKLSALQELALLGGAGQQDQQLVQAAASLKGLRRLALDDFQGPAIAQLSSITALSSLTGLALQTCHLNDQLLGGVLSQLPCLQSLSLSGNYGLSDAVVSVVAQQQQLTTLHLGQTGVTLAGLQQLSGLTRLKALRCRAGRAVWSDLCWLTALVQLEDFWVDDAWLSAGDCQRFKRQMPWLRSCRLIHYHN